MARFFQSWCTAISALNEAVGSTRFCFMPRRYSATAASTAAMFSASVTAVCTLSTQGTEPALMAAM